MTTKTPMQKMEQKISSVTRRTAGDSIDALRLKLAVSEMNEANALDERDYLLSAEWKPVVEDVAIEIEEAMRLSHRLDCISARRVQEILAGALNRFAALRNMPHSAARPDTPNPPLRSDDTDDGAVRLSQTEVE